jgi:hypothetical protein
MGASNYTYLIPEQDPWKNRNPVSKEDAFLDKLDAAGARRLAELAIASEEDKEAAMRFSKDEATFRVMYPAYRDTTQNAKAMKLYWEEVLGVAVPSLVQMEESFFELRRRDALQLDAKAVAKENERDILQRAAEIREAREANAFDEAEAYTMPLQEVERRARAGW